LEVEAVMDDAEQKRRSDALYKVFIRLPKGARTLDDWLVREMSQQLVRASITGNTDELEFSGANRKREREKLCNVQKLAQKLSREVRGLHVHTKSYVLPMVSHAGVRISDWIDQPAPVSEEDHAFWMRFWDTLATLDHVVDRALPEVKAQIDELPELGKRKPHIIAIVKSLRSMFEGITGRAPPKNVTDAVPFANFLRDAFKAMGVRRTPRSAMNAWRAYYIVERKKSE
jgi:hypothetical protein